MSVFPPGMKRRAPMWSQGQLNPLADLDSSLLPEGLPPLISQHTASWFRWLASQAAEKQAHDAIALAEEADRQARVEALRKRKDPPPATKGEAEAAANAAAEAREDIGLAGAQIETEIVDLLAGNQQWAATVSARLDEQDKAVSAALDVIAGVIRDRGRLRWALDIATGTKSLDKHAPVDLEAEATMTAIKAALAEVQLDPEKAIGRLPLRRT